MSGPEALLRGRSGADAFSIAVTAARRAGEVIRTHFAVHKSITFKSRGNLLTDVDLLAEKQVLDLLREEFPGHGVLSEESPRRDKESGYYWIVDPLDGTRNYASNLPHVCTTVALRHDAQTILGVVYDPLREEAFTARAGLGATLNGEPIHVGGNDTLLMSLLGTDMGYSDERGKVGLDLMASLWPGLQSLRIMGSAALGLCYAACGRLDLYFHHLLYPWDAHAAVLCIQEAGGIVTDRAGREFSLWSDSIVAGNARVHADFMRLAEGHPWRTAEWAPLVTP